jgi:hypothetical protein
MRLSRIQSLCVYVGQISAIFLQVPSGRDGLYKRLCFSGTPASPLTEHDAHATSYWPVVARQMVFHIGRRLLRIARLMLTVHAMTSTGGNPLAGTAR